MYISVSDAATKFNISKRRVQILCEQGRIDGASMLSGVWLIPENAPKPIDARKKGKFEDQISIFDDSLSETLTLHQVCNLLSISKATAQNWIRLGKLTPANNNLEFDKQYVYSLYMQIVTGDSHTLKSRRNKTAISGISVYKDYIQNIENIASIESIKDEKKPLGEFDLRVVMSNFAIQLYYQRYDIPFDDGNVLLDFLEKQSRNTEFYHLIVDLLCHNDLQANEIAHLFPYLKLKLKFNSYEDTLGFAYISLKDLGTRKATGVYYTPQKTVISLIENLVEIKDLKELDVIDPCCGTGNFLIGLLNAGADATKLFGQDIDDISIQITRINVFLLSRNISLQCLYSNFTCGNTLNGMFSKTFDVVLGNPPWGYNFSAQETEELSDKYSIIKGKNVESYDLFIEKSLSMLKPEGLLSFVLPEAILNVSAHTPIRKLILENFEFKYVHFLGNAFSGVQCPSIIFGVTLGGKGNTKGCKIITSSQAYVIYEERQFDDTGFYFDVSDEENECLQSITSIKNVVYLKNNARFALGIVTGNNKGYITNKRTSHNEIILKGSDIFRYNVQSPENYICFTPEKFQQVAPTEVYRAPEKLLYRFICEVPVFAYDNKQTLSLNSCNIVIPQIEGLSVKYVLAILNSSVVAYYITKRFKSIKLLRSHIEQIPIPFVDSCTQLVIEEKVNLLLDGSLEFKKVYYELDEIIMNLYSLSDFQKQTIRNFICQKNDFLQ